MECNTGQKWVKICHALRFYSLLFSFVPNFQTDYSITKYLCKVNKNDTTKKVYASCPSVFVVDFEQVFECQ